MTDVGPLDGIRVLDLSLQFPGPYATMVLADLGADVLKVEPPGSDPVRAFMRATYDALAWNKRTISIDLKSSEGLDSLLGLADDADVVVEGFRPGVADRLGVGYPALSRRNPGIVYCSISGYGREGPLGETAGHDLNYQGLAGALHPSEDQDVMVAPFLPLADLAGGTFAALAVTAGLLERERTGRGRLIDLALADCMMSWLGPAARNDATGSAFSPTVPSYRAFRCGDGEWLTLGIVHEEHFWVRLCGVLSLDDELRTMPPADRAANAETVSKRLSAAFRTNSAAAWLELLDGADVPAGPLLRPAEAAAHPQFLSRGVTGDIDGAPVTASPLHFAPRRFERRPGGDKPAWCPRPDRPEMP
jgi:crotonobetainyl-CoA:carnitine CoA-transferase CaiB-like acyl-CoA transferase